MRTWGSPWARWEAVLVLLGRAPLGLLPAQAQGLPEQSTRPDGGGARERAGSSGRKVRAPSV